MLPRLTAMIGAGKAQTGCANKNAPGFRAFVRCLKAVMRPCANSVQD